MPEHRTRVVARMVRYTDPVLQVERLRTYGYEARCLGCPWRSGVRPTWRDATDDARWHRRRSAQ